MSKHGMLRAALIVCTSSGKVKLLVLYLIDYESVACRL